MKRYARRIVIAGGTGALGRALIEELRRRGASALVLSRRSQPVPGSIGTVLWDGREPGEWTGVLEGSWGVVNLAGESIDQLWTPESMRRIRESRVQPTMALGAAIQGCVTPPRVWLNASAAGYYGDTGDEPHDETSPPGTGFLAETCQAWEQAQTQWSLPGTRLARVRIGPVLSAEDGMLPRLARIARRFAGGSLGTGRQWMSWIHERDLARLMADALFDAEWPEVVNGAAPKPVRNATFMATLRRVLHRPWAPPVPVPVLNLFKGLVRVEPELAVLSQRVVSAVAEPHGFEFHFPSLEPALRDLL